MPEATARTWTDADPAVPPAAAFPPHLRVVESSAAPERRTVVIRGQVAPPRRRPPRRAHERVGPRPDRIALWAVLLGVFLIVVAAMSAHVGV